MATSQFKLWNGILAWSVFAISILVYAFTVEPTVSFWDSGEYIATSAKLQVAHSPGAPLFQMLGSFFALFAATSKEMALMVNYVSVVASAFTILLLFLTITDLVRKLGLKDQLPSKQEAIAVLGSGFVGALAFTFSDSFWFNATETEVYSMASLMMALLLWLGLKWTDNLDRPRGDKWLVLISFVTGLTFGIQFMGFLAIPSIGLLYYFKTCKKVTIKNFLIANIAVVAILMLVFKFSLTYLLELFGWGEVFFVNFFGFPFNSGSIIAGLLLIGGFYGALRLTHVKGYRKANTGVLCVLFLVLGFSSWLMLPIRASAHVVINENDPSDARSLLAYYNREQYPGTDSPFYGAYYSDRFAAEHPEKNDRPKYEKDEALGKYVIVNDYEGALQGPNDNHVGWLPRMWSEMNAENYMRYYGRLEFKVKRHSRGNNELMSAIRQFREKNAQGEIDTEQYMNFLHEMNDYIDVAPPTLWQNIRYLFHFQLNYMYWRYFMWNFTGRQNDIQGRFDGNGEWLSGFDFLDGWRLGSQNNLPSEATENKGRNTYFFLPFALGLIGILFQIRKNAKQFWVLFVFFLFTGVAIQFYTNPPIFQPRERDYSLVGSFYVFAIWMGLGVFGLFRAFQKFFRPGSRLLVLLFVGLCAIPGLMAHQNWDDHDRSDRYTALAMAKAYLDSTQKDSGAMLFTIGDIDTFPLWYAQEIENYRTDTRVIISGYLNFAWYIDQIKRKAYDSWPIPSQLTHEKYKYGTRDVVYYAPISDKRWDIKDFMNWISSDRPETKVRSLLERQGRDTKGYSEAYLNSTYYPTNKIRVSVNKPKVLQTGLVKIKDAEDIVDYIDIDLPETGIAKNRLLMLDIVANNDWNRPIYFSGGSFDEEEYIWMTDYLQLDGLVYKLVPIKTKKENIFEKGRIDADLMYDMVKNWEWGNSGSSEIYHDPQTRKQFGVTHRIALARLLEKLLEEKQIGKAKEIIDLTMAYVPVEHFGYHAFVEPFLDGYYKAGESESARELFQRLKSVYQERLEYYTGLSPNRQFQRIEEVFDDVRAYRRILDILMVNKDTDFAEKETLIFNKYVDTLEDILNSER